MNQIFHPMVKYVCVAIASVMFLSASWSCSQGGEPAGGEEQGEIAGQLAQSISGQDVHGLLSLVREGTTENERFDARLADVLAIRWGERPPASSRDVQRVLYGDTELQITSEIGRFVQSLGKMYDSSELTEDEYARAMLLIDAILSSVLASHEELAQDNVSTLQSALTQAALLRVVIAQELRKYGLEDQSVLDDDDMQLLRDMARTHDFSKLGQIP